MAVKRKVAFLQYFNGYRMLMFFEADTVGVLAGLFVFTYIMFTNAGVPLSLIVVLSFFIGVGGTFIYTKTKKGASKGYLRHLLYVNGIYSVKEDPTKFKEVKRLDVSGYLPNHNDLVFSD